jgi:uncharacterized protein involved in cysteine biosynthesis
MLEQELIKLGLQGGVAISVLLVLYFILSKISEIVKNKNGENLSKKIEENRIERLENIVLELSERVSRLEAKINGKIG